MDLYITCYINHAIKKWTFLAVFMCDAVNLEYLL